MINLCKQCQSVFITYIQWYRDYTLGFIDSKGHMNSGRVGQTPLLKAELMMHDIK